MGKQRRPSVCRCVFVAILLLTLCPVARAREYHLDPAGDDAADGSSKTPWKSLARVQQAQLSPGDIVRLHRGGVWKEKLWVTSAGTPEAPIVFTDYGTGALPIITGEHVRPMAIECSQSNIVFDSLHLTGANSPERGALSIWVYQDLQNVTLRNCTIEGNDGSGVWVSGEKDKQLKGVFIHHNTISDNTGSGILMSKGAAGEISHNLLLRNCQKNLSPWQAGIRVWSGDQFNLKITQNRVAEQRYHLEEGAGCGIHVDETGPGIEVTDNDIADTDAAGILIENTRGVRVENNVIARTHTGIFVYRAGHDHTITRNTIVDSHELGIVLQGLVGNGVNMGPEMVVDGHRLTGNRVTRNIALGSKYASLKCIEGGERIGGKLGNDYSDNCLGKDRRDLVEWGSKRLLDAGAWKRATGMALVEAELKFKDKSNDDYRVTDSVDVGATR